MTHSSKTAGPVARAIATGLGIGYAPLASGTFGSLWGLLLAWGLTATGGRWGVVAGLFLVTAVGAWATEVTAAAIGTKDPGVIVVDEIAGQLVALMFIPLTGPTVIAAFLLFRLFDIWKPYPVRRLEELPGASGIMADDLLAGTYANLVLQALIRIFPHGWNLT